MRVSVIIPVYNAAAYVGEAAESALAQPETKQVILVDDGSTDGSLDVCRKLANRHKQIEVLRHPDGANLGAAASRNLGCSVVACEYLAFLDADDYYLPDRFRIPREILTANPNVDGVYEAIGTLYQDEQVGQWYRSKRYPGLITLTEPVEPSELFDALLAGVRGYFCTDGIVVRTELFKRAQGFDTSLRMCEDTALWLKMSVLGRLVAGSLTEPVGMRRLHGNNTIYQNQSSNSYYATRMAESLLAWAYVTGISSARLIRLLDMLLNFQLAEVPCDAPYLWRKLKEMSLFTRFGLRHPLVLRSPHYWAVIKATAGWRRCKDAIGGMAPTLFSMREDQ